VPGIEPVVAAATGLRSDQVSGFVEAVLVDWSSEDEDQEFPVQMHLPVDRAFGFGFVDAVGRREVMAQARAATNRAMIDVITGLPEHQAHHREELVRAMGDDRLFRRIAGQLDVEFRVAKAMWVWPGRSVADEVSAGTRADAVQWLASSARRTCARILQQSMHQAWRGAFAASRQSGGPWSPL
jgi:hypothetical protein